MYWCICRVNEFKVLESGSAIVQQPGGLTQDMVNQYGMSFQAALLKLETSINNSRGASREASYKVCTFGDWPVLYQLALDAIRCGIELPEALTSNLTNLLELHYENIASGEPVSTLEELLSAHSLSPVA